MTRHVRLDPIEHASLRLITDRSAGLGDGVMMAPLFPHEFRQAQAWYPIVFSRETGSGRLRPFALFGLEKGSNLFLSGQVWDAAFIPAAHRMKPFLIGRGADGLKVDVDLDHPRLSEATGEQLFLPDGTQAPALAEVAGLLAQVHEAEEALPGFSAMMDELGLFEPFTLDVTLDSGEQGRLAGFETVSEETLYSLDGATLARLQAAGFLQPIFMAVASLSQFVRLIQRRNALDAKAAV